MKSFRTEIPLPPAPFNIGLKNQIVTMGSCFADSIGQFLTTNKFTVCSNPGGVLYSPLAIHKVLNYAAKKTTPLQDSYLINHDVWSNYDFHSALSSLSRQEIEAKISKSISVTSAALEKSDVCVITYGTAWIFEKIDTGEPVANCHKMPSVLFRKRLLDPDEIVKSFVAAHENLKTIRPDLHVILTLSPVRHLKDTLVLNSVSKSTLRLAIHQIISHFPEVEYFPAYEILTDELRDYRFYASDMLHPSGDAVSYIFDKFSEKYFSKETRDFILRWSSISSSLNHNAFHPDSQSHQAFLKNILRDLEELKSYVSVEEEIRSVTQKITGPLHQNS